MKKFFKGALKYFLIPLVVLIFLVSAGLAGYITVQKNREANIFKIDTANGIQETEYLELGGAKQWISMRGQKKLN